MGLNVDVKGTIYEGLLERNAGEVKSGAGQYFTPRPLIDAITEVVDPEPHQTVHDPAVGTGGFLLSAYEHMRKKPAAQDRRAAKGLRETRLSGTDIVAEVVRLCAMNLYLHGIGGATSPVTQKDALLDRGSAGYDVILTTRRSASASPSASCARTAASTASGRTTFGTTSPSPRATNSSTSCSTSCRS